MALSNLTDSQTLQLTFQSKEMAQPYIEDSQSRVDITVDRAISLDDGTQFQCFTVSGIGLRSYLDIIERRPPVIDTEVISSVSGTHRREIHSDADSLFATFAEHGGHPKGGIFEDGTLRILGEFPATVDENTVVEKVTEIYPHLNCVSRQLVSTPKLSRTLLEETLSDRQWTAFQLAYYTGYFDRQRKSTGKDIADQMGITKQTFHRHLREAQRRVAQFIIEDLDDDRLGITASAE